jgi:hypothetical protein
MTSLERVLLRLPYAKRSRSGWMSPCPAHDDDRPSLSIAAGNYGIVLLHCHAGCTCEAVVKSMGLEMSDLMPAINSKPSRATVRSKVDRSACRTFDTDRDAFISLQRKWGKRSEYWTYHNAEGEAVGHVIRWNKP